MIPRLAGAAAVAAAGVWCGLIRAAALRRELRRQEGLRQMLELLACELERFRTPLPALFAELAERLPAGEASALCACAAAGLAAGMSFSDVWSAAVRALPAGEREIISPLGGILGRYGAPEQAAAVAAARGRMEALAAESRGSLRDRRRVRIGVCAAAGALLAVLLY